MSNLLKVHVTFVYFFYFSIVLLKINEIYIFIVMQSLNVSMIANLYLNMK